MDVVAISDGNVVIVNQPSVKELETDESFCTESFSVTNEGEEAENETDALPSGPLSGFRRRRAERVTARLSLQEERKKDREEERRRAEDEQKKIKEAIPERLIEPDLASSRAGKISVTVVKDESNSYGIGLAQVPRKKNLVKIDALLNEGGLLCQSPLKEGDILKTVNNEEVVDYRSVMLQLMKMKGPVTMSVETQAPESNPAVVQAFCRKPTPDTLLGIEFEVVEHSTTQNDLCGDLNGTQEVTTSRLLQIKNIEPDGFLAHSALSRGDFVLAINGTPCTEMSSEDAAAMIIDSESTVSVLALNPKLAQEHCSPTRVQRWMRRARLAGVGAVGGTMRK
jgi:C-terminal processing protease CtpA/Prc